MIANRRTLTYVAIALIVGATLALAGALARGDAPLAGSEKAAGQTQAQGGVLGDTTGASMIASADPAKQEPLLDKFTAKDPFVPLYVATPTPSPTATSNPSLSARVKVNGTTYTVVTGDKVPSGSPAFTISGITSGDVTFAVIAEGGLENGGTHNGHTISVLSITSSNGTAMAAFEVDGKTYADKKVGVVFSTSAGEIKVIAINVSAQTVTIVLGDQTITLHAGQVVVK